MMRISNNGLVALIFLMILPLRMLPRTFGLQDKYDDTWTVNDGDNNSNRTFSDVGRMMTAQLPRRQHVRATMTSTTTSDQNASRNSRPSPAAPIYSACGLSSTIRFVNWFGDTFTYAPVLFPHNDAELLALVQQVRDYNQQSKNNTNNTNPCRIRVRGSGHSAGGFILQKQEYPTDTSGTDSNHVVVMHLQNYTPPDAWNWILDVNTARVRVSTGTSILQVMAFVRPQGYIFPTNSAMLGFNVGGFFLNPSTHGSTIGAKRATTLIMAARVLLADGTMVEYMQDDPELLDMRGSMGLLGIVTAVELQLRRDTGLVMSYSRLALPQGYPEDAQTQQMARDYIRSRHQQHDGVHIFHFSWQDEFVTLQFDYNAGGSNYSFDPSTTIPAYEELMHDLPNVAYDGSTKVLQSASPQDDATQARAVMKAALDVTILSLVQSGKDRNDGYYVDPRYTTLFQELVVVVPCHPVDLSDSNQTICLDEIMALFWSTRTFLNAIVQTRDNDWYPTNGVGWRVLYVGTNDMTLNPLMPTDTHYVAFELSSTITPGSTVQAKYYKQLEDLYRGLFPGLTRIHMGKSFAFGTLEDSDSGDVPVYYQHQDNNILDHALSDTVKKTFTETMQRYDPDGLFRAGFALRLLGLTNATFTPKQYVGDTCPTNDNEACLSGCCGPNSANNGNSMTIDSSSRRSTTADSCLAVDRSTGDTCTVDCQCTTTAIASDQPSCRYHLCQN